MTGSTAHSRLPQAAYILAGSEVEMKKNSVDAPFVLVAGSRKPMRS
jgi:hypothetical protein